MAPEHALRELQEEYFDIIEDNPLVSQCEQRPDDSIAIPPDFFDTRKQLFLTVGMKYQPAALTYLEKLFDELNAFWRRHADEYQKQLNQLDGRYLYVAARDLQSQLRRYGLFFDGLLVTEQLMLTRTDFYAGADETDRGRRDWPALIRSVIKSAFLLVANRGLFLPIDRRPYAYVVPPRWCVNVGGAQTLFGAAGLMQRRFLSELFQHSFASSEEVVEYIAAHPHLDKAEPRFLALLFKKFRVTDSRSYVAVFAALLRTHEGLGWNPRLPAELAFSDLIGRFAEFERFHADAFAWRQEGELPEDDLDMYDWWLSECSKTAGNLLVSSLSEDEMYKAAALSSQMSFLDDVDDTELLRVLDSDPVSALREDLAATRCRIRRAPSGSLQSTINSAGEYIDGRVAAFERDMLETVASARLTGVRQITKLAATAAMSYTIGLFPPLSALGLLWSGSLAETVSEVSTARRHWSAEEQRPIAALVRWRRGAKGPVPRQILGLHP